jgi:hypothetical protein
MAFYVAKNEDPLDFILSPETMLKSNADYYAPRFEAIKEMREKDDGTGYAGQEFRRVASFVNVPMFLAAKLEDPAFLKDKKRFYAFIDKHPQYVAYQRRNGGRGTARDDLKLPLSALGLDYPGAPKTVEDFEVVEIPAEPVGENSMGPATDTEPIA